MKKGEKEMIDKILNYIHRKQFERYLREAEMKQLVEKHIKLKSGH